MLFIGVDGGGTHSTLAACDENGKLLAYGEGGALNYNSIGLNAARSNLAEACAALLSSCGRQSADIIALGSSALDAPATDAELRAFAGDVFDPEKLLLDSDVEMSLLGAALGRPGMMLISGTGAIGAAVDSRGRRYVAGGWGYRFGDPGSGYSVGFALLRAAVRDVERGEHTAMTELLMAKYKLRSLRELIPIVYAPTFAPSDVAALAVLACRAAEEGDDKALQIINDAADEMAALAEYLRSESGTTTVCLYGGLFEKSPLFRASFEKKLAGFSKDIAVREPELPAECGALLAAAAKAGLDTDKFASELKKSRAALR